MRSRSGSLPSHEPVCSIERCLQILSDRWSFLILREVVFGGVTRFADFQRILGVAERADESTGQPR
jgi:DNA-binding HxlR family transcriptional regulator